jgi:hypothetical protein
MGHAAELLPWNRLMVALLSSCCGLDWPRDCTLVRPGRPGVRSLQILLYCAVLLLTSGCSQAPSSQKQTQPAARELDHDGTLRWIADHKAWRLAKKTKPIWARPILDEEVGKEFQTADQAKERARQGFWLCVGVAEEPWFQSPEKVAGKYDLAGAEDKRFAFDAQARSYQIYRPKQGARSWAAQIVGADIAGFSIKPNYDPSRPLHAPSGGYVVRDYVSDPYRANPADVWLVQQKLFESTYDWANDP